MGDIIIIIFKYALISETANIQERCRGTLHSQFSTLRPVSIKSVKCGLRKERFKLLASGTTRAGLRSWPAKHLLPCKHI